MFSNLRHKQRTMLLLVAFLGPFGGTMGRAAEDGAVAAIAGQSDVSSVTTADQNQSPAPTLSTSPNPDQNGGTAQVLPSGASLNSAHPEMFLAAHQSGVRLFQSIAAPLSRAHFERMHRLEMHMRRMESRRGSSSNEGNSFVSDHRTQMTALFSRAQNEVLAVMKNLLKEPVSQLVAEHENLGVQMKYAFHSSENALSILSLRLCLQLDATKGFCLMQNWSSVRADAPSKLEGSELQQAQLLWASAEPAVFSNAQARQVDALVEVTPKEQPTAVAQASIDASPDPNQVVQLPATDPAQAGVAPQQAPTPALQQPQLWNQFGAQSSGIAEQGFAPSLPAETFAQPLSEQTLQQMQVPAPITQPSANQ